MMLDVWYPRTHVGSFLCDVYLTRCMCCSSENGHAGSESPMSSQRVSEHLTVIAIPKLFQAQSHTLLTLGYWILGSNLLCKYHMVWIGMKWYDMIIWYEMKWYDMIRIKVLHQLAWSWNSTGKSGGSESWSEEEESESPDRFSECIVGWPNIPSIYPTWPLKQQWHAGELCLKQGCKIAFNTLLILVNSCYTLSSKPGLCEWCPWMMTCCSIVNL